MGGEESGGFAFRGHMPERDGILAGLCLLDLMVRTGKTPSELLDHIFGLVGPHYYDRIDRRCRPRKARRSGAGRAAAQPTSPRRAARARDRQSQRRFRYVLEDGGWLLIRFSGTEPVIRVYCETTHSDKVQDGCCMRASRPGRAARLSSDAPHR
jgi:phosphomannomutase